MGGMKALPLARKDGEVATRLAVTLGHIYMASEQLSSFFIYAIALLFARKDGVGL